MFKKENEETLFFYGQVQKWVNITLKNMLVMELWDKDFEKIRNCLHVPIDNVILKPIKCDLGISFSVKSWSRWNSCEYKKLQVDIRDKLKNKSPIDWEYEKWSEETVAQKE